MLGYDRKRREQMLAGRLTWRWSGTPLQGGDPGGLAGVVVVVVAQAEVRGGYRVERRDILECS